MSDPLALRLLRAVAEALGVRLESEEGGVWLGWEGSSRVGLAVYSSPYPAAEDVYALVARLASMPVEKGYVVVTREAALLLDASVFREGGVGLVVAEPGGRVEVRVPARARRVPAVPQLDVEQLVARVVEEVRRRLLPTLTEAVMVEVRRYVEERLREFRAEVARSHRAAEQPPAREQPRQPPPQAPGDIASNVWVSVLRSRG